MRVGGLEDGWARRTEVQEARAEGMWALVDRVRVFV